MTILEAEKRAGRKPRVYEMGSDTSVLVAMKSSARMPAPAALKRTSPVRRLFSLSDCRAVSSESFYSS